MKRSSMKVYVLTMESCVDYYEQEIYSYLVGCFMTNEEAEEAVEKWKALTNNWNYYEVIRELEVNKLYSI